MERICEVCGKPLTAGMTDDLGSFYCCEDCFEKYMDRTYGRNGWRETEDDGIGGYYEAMGESKWEREGTGIYYTEWEDE